jgi:CBS domain-containing protein
MKARDIMSSDTECVSATDTLETAARRMAAEGVGSMPICGDDDRLKGMLTDRDIVVRAIARGKDVARTLVAEFAEGKPVTIGADDSIRETLATMERAQVRRLPVIDGYRLVGIISAADVARHLSPRKSGKLLQEISKPRRRRPAARLMQVALVTGSVAGASYLLRKQRSARRAGICQSTVVNVPIRSAYDQWTQFEEFPSFMEGIEQVEQLDERRLHWRGKVAGKVRDWDATITEQVPDERIAWEATSGKRNDGIVRFEPLGIDKTRVEVEMAFEPEGVAELVGSAIGLPERRVKGDLERFRELIEARGGQASGVWRGKVEDSTS